MANNYYDNKGIHPAGNLPNLHVLCSRLLNSLNNSAVLISFYVMYKSYDIKTIVSIWRENMLGYLSADIICSEKRTVF